ncbi:MAG: SUMF1/EgtB/PvdO family nonheme iron enzyme [Bacteroidales bacterium]|nr:SUMF1/EgtB/PvdO family nonheme iron enzyme [Bacteroidales bacterium]
MRLFPVILIPLMLWGCGGKDVTSSGKVSTTTGWAYNDPENGGFEVQTAAEQETGPGLVLIEGGTFTMGRAQDDVQYDWNNVPRRVTVSSFYMDFTEIRNVDYREYLNWLTRVFGMNNPQVVNAALPDTLVWRDPMAYNEPFVEYYYRHPSFNEYPVVGVNWLQANDYCIWRTDRVNEMILVDMGHIELSTDQQDERNFNTEAYIYGIYTPNIIDPIPSLNPNVESRLVTVEDGLLLPKYRLPTEAEWEFAAFGLIGNSVDELVWERRTYPWNGHNVRNDDPRVMGIMMANFVRGKGDLMGVAGSLNDAGSVTVPVMSYWPNDYGLYCMAGNVNEWVQDVYRPMSYVDVSDFRSFRGNQFEKLTRDANNSPVIDSLGRLRSEPITVTDAEGRFNYRKSDYRNYMDGDKESVFERGEMTQEAYTGSESMYMNEGQERISLMNDDVRVYKGGSWKDRAYWLSPGERRFLLQTESRDDLGFRCAMTRVGTPTGF